MQYYAIMHAIKEVKMPTLQVRDLPEDVYIKLTMLAKKENRSIAQQTLVLLKQGLALHANNQIRRQALLAKISEANFSDTSTLDASKLIREDRDR